MDTTLSSQLYSSRDNIRSQIIEYLKTYLELENITLTKGGFLSFLVNILSTLTSNLMFYQSSTYNEFFLTKAKLPESVLNLASFLGYNTSEAKYSTVSTLITIPLTFTSSDITINILDGHKFYASSIPFVTYYTTSIHVVNNSEVTATINESGNIRSIPVIVDSTSNEFYFSLNLRQYTSNDFQFQIDQDLQPYQFTDIDVPLSGKVSSLIVKVKDPNSSTYTLYTEFNSLFLMTSDDYGYVNRRTDTGRRIYFGNGLIGVQPLPGSTVDITVIETQGEDGNVIAGTIVSGDRMYTVDGTVTKTVNYTVTNPSAASGGEDEESIEDIRTNSINNLTSLGRLVSENDYKNVDVIIPNSPFSNSLAILKRSDVKINEVELFTTLNFNNEIVPTRNTYLEINDSSTLNRLSIVQIDGVDYYTLLDLTVDYINKIAYYEYIIYQLAITPTLVQSYGVDYDIVGGSLDITRAGNQLTFELSYTSTEIDYSLASCVMAIHSNDTFYTMTNDYANKKFIYTFSNYTDIPTGQQTFYFTLYNPSNQTVARYSVNVTVRKSLDDFMMSNVSTDSTSTIVYDIPVVLKSYYDSIDQRSFELYTLQSIINIDFLNYRMLTDFINIKFSNTIGSFIGMTYNTTTKLDVISNLMTSVPTSFVSGDRYIVNGTEGGDWTSQKDKIAQSIDSSSWIFIDPVYNDIVYITSTQTKLIFTGQKWSEMVFQIPLTVSLDVYKTANSTLSDIELSNLIKSTLISSYSSRFGINAYIYRSEIIRTVQDIDGVDHCILVHPSSDLFLSFNIDDFTQDQLLKYSPEYMYFTTDSISVNVV